MESQMTKEDLKTVIKCLQQQLEIAQKEKQDLVRAYENQKRFVKNLGIATGLAMLLHITVIEWLMSQDNLSLYSFGSFIRPFNFMFFMISSVVVAYLGFELFLNTENKYACRINEKMKKTSLVYEIQVYTDNIWMLRQEIDCLHGTMSELQSLEESSSDDDEENSADLWRQDFVK